MVPRRAASVLQKPPVQLEQTMSAERGQGPNGCRMPLEAVPIDQGGGMPVEQCGVACTKATHVILVLRLVLESFSPQSCQSGTFDEHEVHMKN